VVVIIREVVNVTSSSTVCTVAGSVMFAIVAVPSKTVKVPDVGPPKTILCKIPGLRATFAEVAVEG